MDKTRSAALVEIERQNSQFTDSKAELERQISQLKSELSMCKSQLKQLGNSVHSFFSVSYYVLFRSKVLEIVLTEAVNYVGVLTT